MGSITQTLIATLFPLINWIRGLWKVRAGALKKISIRNVLLCVDDLADKM